MAGKPIAAVEMGRRGGATRAKRYSKRQIREWGRRGGRPAKLNRRDIKRLCEQLRQGEPKSIVAKKFGISVRTLDRYLGRNMVASLR